MSKAQRQITDGLKPICKELEAVMNMGHSNYSVFEDWLALMFYAFQRDDENYLKAMQKYPNKDGKEAGHFASATASLMQYMAKTHEEALGELYMQYASNKYQGQFFTPMSVSRVCAAITLKDIPKDRRFTIGDPTCGAGVMFVAAAKEMSFEENNRAIFVGVDTDINCVRMCALNMLFFNLDAVIIWGNSLSLKCRGAWETKRSVAFGGTLRPLDIDIAEKWMKPLVEQAAPMQKTANQQKIEQMALF